MSASPSASAKPGAAATGAAADQAGAGRWTNRAPAPTPRAELAAAATGGRIYLLAGTAGGRGLANEEYDPATDAWRKRKEIPVSREGAGRHHPGAAAWNGKIYLIGGFDFGNRPLDSALEYDPAADAWRALPPMPTPRGALGLVELEGKLYAIGGFGVQGDTGAAERYDPATERWTQLRPMPSPRDHLGLGASGGRLYAIGGRLGSMANNLGVNEEYDPRADGWATRRPMPTPRSGVAAAVLGGRVHVFGGESPPKTFDENEQYDPASDAWSARARMPSPRHGLAAVTVGDQIYVLGGGPTPGGSESALNQVFGL